jgi:hypothetical protein
MRVHTEAVARGRRRADAPARRRCTCFQRLRRTQQQQRQPGIAGGQMQPLAQFRVEPVDETGDGGRRRRMQSLGDRPQRFLAVRGLDQDQTGGIKTKAVEAVTGRPAVGAPTIGRHDEDDLFPGPHPTRERGGGKTGEECCDETKGGRESGLRFGHDFMQSATDEAAFRKVGINDIETERERVAPALRLRQQAAKLGHHNGTISGTVSRLS